MFRFQLLIGLMAEDLTQIVSEWFHVYFLKFGTLWLDEISVLARHKDPGVSEQCSCEFSFK